MTRVAGLAVLALGVGLIALGLVFIREPDSAPTTPIETRIPGSQADSTTVAGELAIFKEVARAYSKATLRARTVAPLPDGTGSPIAPDSASKGAEKRAGITALWTDEMVRQIAAAHRMTIEEVDEIYRRGEAEGWPKP